MKRRLPGRSILICVGNLFLKVSHSRIQMFVHTGAWQTRECESYALLHGVGCEIAGHDALQIIPLPGTSLKAHLDAGSLSLEMADAVAHELRRAHALGWTHGDLHLANVLYDEDRARLVDFETQHDLCLPIAERRADDLLVLCLDLLGHDLSERWPQWSEALVKMYHDGEVLSALAQRLVMPRGWELVLWKTRTHYLRNQELARRIRKLRTLVEQRLYEGPFPTP